MRLTLLLFILFFASCGGSQLQFETEDTLPDDYLPIVLKHLENKLEGGSQYLEGFTFTVELSGDLSEEALTIESLVEIVKNQGASGTLTYPNGKTTPIEFEVVLHREVEEIYMKTTLGYFLWELVEILDGEISFAIYWWYCPPALPTDLEILDMATELLSTEDKWNRNDDRECEDDITNGHFSLFCALKNASIQKMGEYNHHGTAMQQVRFAIDETVPNHGFEHTLMDYNNSETTSHADILNAIEIAKEKIKREIEK